MNEKDKKKKWYHHKFKIIYGDLSTVCEMEIHKIEDGFVIGDIDKSVIIAIPVNSIVFMELKEP